MVVHDSRKCMDLLWKDFFKDPSLWFFNLSSKVRDYSCIYSHTQMRIRTHNIVCILWNLHGFFPSNTHFFIFEGERDDFCNSPDRETIEM